MPTTRKIATSQASMTWCSPKINRRTNKNGKKKLFALWPAINSKGQLNFVEKSPPVNAMNERKRKESHQVPMHVTHALVEREQYVGATV